jgi:hypothetical protein
MEFKTIQNRNGKLLINSLVLTDQIMSVLMEFNQANSYLVNQDSLLCAIEDAQEESDIEKNQFNLCIAILVNSKVYLISNEEEFRDQLTRLDIELYKDIKGCWKSSGLNDLDLCFISNKAA